jgi:hypothetical protein
VASRPARTLLRRSGGVRGRWSDDSGSLPIAMLIVVSGLGLSTALSSSVVTQVNATRSDVGRADALNAAQGGLDVVAAHIRAATDNKGDGRLGLLPCNQVTGDVIGPAPAGEPPAGSQPEPRPGYRVEIRYHEFDPVVVATDNPVLDCYPGSGTTKVPGYAVLTSTGNDGRPNGADRTITATYILRTTNENIPGGLIRVRKVGASNDLCLDAGPIMPTATNNTVLRVQPCDTTGKDLEQKFAYHSNLSLVYVPSKSATNPLGMCLDAGAAPVHLSPVYFKPCTTTSSRQQQWSFTDHRNFVGTNATNDFNDLCFNVETVNTANSRIILKRHAEDAAGNNIGCYVPTDNNVMMFMAEPSVGAGAAENSPNQLVNFAQFGRCLDVPGFNVASEYLTVYPCKQAPKPEKVTWNQRFIVPPLTTSGEVTSGSGRIYTNIAPGEYEKNGRTGNYCLSTAAVTVSSPYATVNACPTTGALPQSMQWKVVRKAKRYTESYRIETVVAGRNVCLTAGTRPADINYDGLSKMVLEPCGDSTAQKWNAPAYVRDPSPLINFGEG